ncbi:MAG: HAD-IIB family hydrolase [Rhodospirillaceae bacterium]
MLPLRDFPDDVRRAVQGVLLDIDDTLSTDGRLTAAAYGALERLQAAGRRVVPVTGRPAGWCDHIARFWPVDAVVGENGAFCFRYDRDARRMRRVYHAPPDEIAANRVRLMAIGAEVCAAVPGAAIAADQAYRETDLAIDFCEDVPPLDRAAVAEIVRLMEAAGLTAKVSSIHVNGWFGDYDKLGMIRRLFAEAFDVELDAAKDRYVYVGDSPNDQPAFAYFPHAVGVANVGAFAAELTDPPAYVTAAAAGAGFAELVDFLLRP